MSASLHSYYLGGLRLRVEGPAPAADELLLDSGGEAFAEIAVRWRPRSDLAAPKRVDDGLRHFSRGPSGYVLESEVSTLWRLAYQALRLVARDLGAIMLHASASEWEGGALAFTGPSGAGKSTASRLIDAPVLSRDRCLLVPGPAPRVFGVLEGGSLDPGLRLSLHRSHVLRGVFRVLQGDDELPTAQRVAGTEATMILRENSFHGAHLGDDESQILEACAAMAEATVVGRLLTSLDTSPAAALASCLNPK